MDKAVPQLSPSNLLTEDKYRKELAAKYQELPQKKENKKQSASSLCESEIIVLVNEVNAYFTSYDQHLLVLISNNADKIELNIINTKTQETVIRLSIDELCELARNLRNHKLNLIERDV